MKVFLIILLLIHAFGVYDAVVTRQAAVAIIQVIICSYCLYFAAR